MEVLLNKFGVGVSRRYGCELDHNLELFSSCVIKELLIYVI